LLPNFAVCAWLLNLTDFSLDSSASSAVLGRVDKNRSEKKKWLEKMWNKKGKKGRSINEIIVQLECLLNKMSSSGSCLSRKSGRASGCNGPSGPFEETWLMIHHRSWETLQITRSAYPYCQSWYGSIIYACCELYSLSTCLQ
jgi:hypothetical protein